MWRTFARFNVVGGLGIAVQLATLAVLVEGLGVEYLPATFAAVGAAITHNFVWHQRWTWRDRAPGVRPRALGLRALRRGQRTRVDHR